MLYKESPWFNLGWLSVGWKTQKNELFLDIREYYFVHENGISLSLLMKKGLNQSDFFRLFNDIVII